MKKAKLKIVSFIILGILCLVMGFAFGMLSDSYKGASIQTGRMVDGKFVADSSSSNTTIGGNSEGVKYYRNRSLIAYAIGAAFIIGAVADYIVYKIRKKQPIYKKRGRVIEKRGNTATVEFEDGNRKRMIVEPNVILTLGDVGEFTYQVERVIEFTAN